MSYFLKIEEDGRAIVLTEIDEGDKLAADSGIEQLFDLTSPGNVYEYFAGRWNEVATYKNINY